jgi:hypothetical protein
MARRIDHLRRVGAIGVTARLGKCLGVLLWIVWGLLGLGSPGLHLQGIEARVRVQVEDLRAPASCRGGALLSPPCHAVGS